MWILYGLYGLCHLAPAMLVVQFGWVTPNRPLFDSGSIMLMFLIMLDIAFVGVMMPIRKKPVVRVVPPWPHCNDRAGRKDQHECIDVAGCPVWVIRE